MAEGKATVVTGGSGYVGWNLLQEFYRQGTPYINIDIKDDPRNDIRDLDAMLEMTRGARSLIHLAALPDVQASMRDPLPTHVTNLTATVNLLECCRRNDIRTFVFISSFAAKDVQSPYGLQKRAAERYCELYSKLFGIKAVVLRLSNLYGGKNYIENKESVIAVFTKRLGRGDPLVVYGGDQTRDFVHIDDVVSGIIGSQKAPKPFEIYEICSGKATSIIGLAELFKRYKPDIRIDREGYRKGDIMHSVGDLSLARDDFGYGPKVKLEKGIEDLLRTMGVL